MLFEFLVGWETNCYRRELVIKYLLSILIQWLVWVRHILSPSIWDMLFFPSVVNLSPIIARVSRSRGS